MDSAAISLSIVVRRRAKKVCRDSFRTCMSLTIPAHVLNCTLDVHLWSIHVNVIFDHVGDVFLKLNRLDETLDVVW